LKTVVSVQLRVECKSAAVTREPEESALLEACAREQLLGKCLAGAVEISSGIVIPSCMYKWSVNPVSKTYPIYSHS
jgi:hypothetical protein